MTQQYAIKCAAQTTELSSKSFTPCARLSN